MSCTYGGSRIRVKVLTKAYVAYQGMIIGVAAEIVI